MRVCACDVQHIPCALQGLYHWVNFVHDSVRRRALQPLEDYIVKLAPPSAAVRENKSGLTYVRGANGGGFYMLLLCAVFAVRRQGYTAEEDDAILSFIRAADKSPQGVKLWVEMEEKKVHALPSCTAAEFCALRR